MKKILIVQAVFYNNISSLLLDGAIDKIIKNNYDYEIITVKGALEIPPAIALASASKNYHGFVALGCVIRGETSHYDIVCLQSAQGIMDLSIKHHLAIGNGIITVENEAQALERASRNLLDKGGFAVEACISLINLKEKFLKQ